MIRSLQSLSLLDILPDSILADEQLAAAAQALDAELQAVTAATVETMHLPRIDVLPEQVVDLLAWQWHVDYYEPLGMDLETKRRLVKESIAWHRIKGTPAAIEAVVSAAFDTSEVKEWYEYGGEPFFFKIITEDVTTDKPTLDRMRRAIDSVKNTRSWLEKIEFILHMADTETATDDATLGCRTITPELYPWRGRLFDGSWNYTLPTNFNGEKKFDGAQNFDGVQDGEEDAKRAPHLFMGGSFNGSWKFGMSTDSRKVYFNSFDVDPLAMLEQQFVLPEQYTTVLDFAGTGRLFNGSWGFGENGLNDTNMDTTMTLGAQDRENVTETSAYIAAETVRENYPVPRLWSFDGAWRFRNAETFNGGAWFGGEYRFDGLPRIADQTTPAKTINGSETFMGHWNFDAPSPVVTFGAGEDAGDKLESAISFTPIEEMAEATEKYDDQPELMTIDRMARIVFNGTKTFNAAGTFAAGYIEQMGENTNLYMTDRIRHADRFDGADQFNGTQSFGDNTGPDEREGITVTEGRWFNGTWPLDGGTTTRFNGVNDFNGAIFFCLTRDDATRYDGANDFNGTFRYKRSGETFNQYSYTA